MSDDHPPTRPRLPSPLDNPSQESTDARPDGKRRDNESRFSPPDRPAAKRTRFSIKFLMLLTLVVAIATAGYNGMTQGGGKRVGALFFTLMAPVLLLIVLSVAQRFLNRRR